MSPQLVFLLLLAAPAPATPPPDGPTRREAAALADPKLTADGVEAAAEDDSPLVLSPWRHRPGTWIAFLPDIGEDDPHPATLHLAVIARAGQRWVAIARADETRTDGDDVPRGTRSYTLDLAPFRLSDTEVALGVRERAEYTYPPEAETSEDLLLYRASGGRLVRVLTVDTLYDWNDPNRDVIMGTDTAVVAVSKNKTAGFFDLVVTAHQESMDPPKTVTTYVWTGERYEKSLRTTLLEISDLPTLRDRSAPELKLIARPGGAAEVAAQVETIDTKKLDAKRVAKQVKAFLPRAPRRGEQLVCDEQARTCVWSTKSGGTTTYRFTPRPAAPLLLQIEHDAAAR